MCQLYHFRAVILKYKIFKLLLNLINYTAYNKNKPQPTAKTTPTKSHFMMNSEVLPEKAAFVEKVIIIKNPTVSPK